ncbi:phasin family protein [Variovorax sp. J22P240]|uniref:phasin family protein n=1 Tax=unclassified Variovorax TaxID=663243 RepID=UPI0025761309|nr:MULTISPECIES: phasin family protein [unclassified Variovorax]MDL9999982.1 phasin family protein [Variovorax sp. J22P240]MDM0051363.1 phasin family protein [Variovorax sp. J22R115]
MATRRDETVSVKKKSAAPATKATPAKKAAPRKRAAAKKAPAPESLPANPAVPSEQAGAKGLLRAGLKALGNVRDDVVKRQTNVIESLLGMGKAPSLDTFGIRKFEDVFDQRVATALERLGMPSAQEIQELREQMRQVLEHLERAESARRKR